MTLKNRIEKLEQKHAAPSIFAFCWQGDTFVSCNGVRILRGKWEKQNPNATIIQLSWGDNDNQN